MTLLDEIADFENLENAFRACLCGKREDLSPQIAFLKFDYFVEKLAANFRLGEKYPWGPYREFYVADPKRRLVSSAPFIDRVAHRAIYQIVDPLIDGRLLPNTYACRRRKGNGRAVAALHQILKAKETYQVVKLDVSRYFASIPHGRLLGKMLKYLPDDSLEGLFRGLLNSHPDMRNGVGLPLGNLTSQVFANFYLHDIDDFLVGRMHGNYLRYMDDMVLIFDSKDEAVPVVREVVRMAEREKLRLPQRKRVWIRNGPVPFLGFIVDGKSIRPLNRNRRRVGRKLREKKRKGLLPSEIERSALSYEAWRSFPLKLIE